MKQIGIIGLGEMGFPMGVNLLQEGYPVHGFDLQPSVIDAWQSAGGTAAKNVQELAAACEIILCCLPSSEAFVRVAEGELLVCLEPGQIVVETGTTQISEMRRLAARFEEKGLILMDAPMSGGPWGVQNKRLQVFVGGQDAVFNKLKPLFMAYAGEDQVHHCGPVGNGQVAKGVNQLFMGLGNAVCLEILAMASREGLQMDQVVTMFSAKFPLLAGVAGKVADNQGVEQGVKFRELPYYIHHAKESGYSLPITEAVYSFCDKGERVTTDDHRQAPSFWHEMMLP